MIASVLTLDRALTGPEAALLAGADGDIDVLTANIGVADAAAGAVIIDETQFTHPENSAGIGADGDDLVMIVGTNGDEAISGGNAAEMILGIGGAGADKLRGGGGGETLEGGTGKDKLVGNGGKDALFGGAGADKLRGGGAKDTLDGGEGKDILHGGGGRDLFVFADAKGQDLVRDFRNGQDKLMFEGASSLADLKFVSQGSHTIVSFGAIDALLRGTSIEEFNQSDFIF